MPRKKRDVKGERAVHTYAYLDGAAHWALESAESNEDGASFASMFAILGAVHSVEAYMNHLGQRLFKNWDEDDLRTPKEKFRALRERFGLTPTTYDSDYQLYLRGLLMRDKLVHGRTEYLSGEWSSDLPENRTLDVLKTDWENMCNPTDARKIFEACEGLMKALAQGAGDREDPYHDYGFSYAEKKPKPEPGAR